MKPPSFGDVWAEAETIQGMVRRGDMKELYKRACAVAHEDIIVEIGCWHGRSTIILASSGRTVLAIDPMELGGWLNTTEVDIAALRMNLSRYDNVTWIRGTSDDVPDPKQSVGLLFIDGNHLSPWPGKDYVRFAPHLTDGACVVWHDYPSAVDVKRAVERLRPSYVLGEFLHVETTLFCSYVAHVRQEEI